MVLLLGWGGYKPGRQAITRMIKNATVNGTCGTVSGPIAYRKKQYSIAKIEANKTEIRTTRQTIPRITKAAPTSRAANHLTDSEIIRPPNLHPVAIRKNCPWFDVRSRMRKHAISQTDTLPESSHTRQRRSV